MREFAKTLLDRGQGPDHGQGETMINMALETVRRHLDMEVAYLSEFVGDRTVFRFVSAPGLEAMIKPGDSRGITEVYCLKILDGRLPGIIRDTHDEPECLAMPITHAVPIRAHVSVPIRRNDGSVFGMFCCLSPRPNPGLTDRDLRVMDLFGGIAGEQLNSALAAIAQQSDRRARLDRAMAGDYRVVFQPICDLRTRAVVGYEALCRFGGDPSRTPDQWFADASLEGQGVALECAVIARALLALPDLPDGAYLSVNASPETVCSDLLYTTLLPFPPDRIQLEVTEQAVVRDYDRLIFALDRLRERHIRLAVDDAGAGYSGLQHILRVRPDVIKLDMSLTRNVHLDHARAALAEALAGFAAKTSALIVAEGIETEEELALLGQMGITMGQGWLLGRPADLPARTRAAS
jgi:EAL domain-containing protein (putative c-di-GMP-specific phosphodiesterase class I)